MKNQLKVIGDTSEDAAAPSETIEEGEQPSTSHIHVWTRLLVALALALGAVGLMRGIEQKHRSENAQSAESAQSKK